MQFTRYTVIFVFLLLIGQALIPVHAQQGFTPTITKPKEFSNRTLRSEKSTNKKLKGSGRFIQNTVTHYNWYFNAHNKLKEVLERAKYSFVDDFSQLIPFYNYSLDATAADSVQLDSLSYKAQTAIVLHDLRSDWIDNMYLIWGASYYLQKQFDSARMMFQFINYAFAEKEKDGTYRAIGSARDGNNAFTISTVEKNKFLSEPPSRNDAFIWQIRNYLAQDKIIEAGSLIEMLKSDPEFPKRLDNDLEEMQALLFYKQGMWDSCANHLVNALSNANGQQEKARWEYLIGQLYELSGKYKEAEDYYGKSINHTTNPIMDVYARLSSVRVNKDGGENYIDKNIAELVKMAHRDKYLDYRDIIYYMAAQMELERNRLEPAMDLLLKSTKYATNDPSQRNRAFLQLADLSYRVHRYRDAHNFYDSLKLDDPTLKDPEIIVARRAILKRVVDNLDIRDRQDSLQRIAAMPEDERKAFVKKVTKQVRKQQGLKEEPMTTGSSPVAVQPPSQPLFNDNRKGEWYFYNATTRQKGLADFKAKWGTRPNADNWRRSSALMAIIQTQLQNSQSQYNRQIAAKGGPTFTAEGPPEITYDLLYSYLPLTEERLKLSNDSIMAAQFELGSLYIDELDDCNSGTTAFEDLRKRFPSYGNMSEVLYKLYFCYNKNGETAKAATIKQLMTQNYPASNLTAIVTTGKNPDAQPVADATKTYERIYDQFIEGNFADAIAQKKEADQKYGQNYWTPQLLYIESVYYIKQRQDSTAKVVLNNIISRFPGTPIETKATTMIDVLNRRAQIEEELRNMVVESPTGDTTTRYRPGAYGVNTNVPQTQPKRDSIGAAPSLAKVDSVGIQKTATAPVVAIPKVDSNLSKAPTQQAVAANVYAYRPEEPHYVVVVLTKVDQIYVNEAKNAFARYNRDTYYNKQMQAELVDIDADNKLVLISPFNNALEALDYVEKTRPVTGSEILPWLKGGKYNYSIITARNLDLLKNNKDIDKYTRFLNEHFPGKF